MGGPPSPTVAASAPPPGLHVLLTEGLGKRTGERERMEGWGERSGSASSGPARRHVQWGPLRRPFAQPCRPPDLQLLFQAPRERYPSLRKWETFLWAGGCLPQEEGQRRESQQLSALPVTGTKQDHVPSSCCIPPGTASLASLSP